MLKRVIFVVLLLVIFMSSPCECRRRRGGRNVMNRGGGGVGKGVGAMMKSWWNDEEIAEKEPVSGNEVDPELNVRKIHKS
jgi:hypothetical protein